MGRPSKGCGTCKDRRVKCDNSMPTCLQCRRYRLACQGYGLRLSWPGENGRKQGAIITKPSCTGQIQGNIRLVNTTTWDMEIHHLLSGSIPGGCQPIMPISMHDGRLDSTAKYELFQYFDEVVSHSLTTVGRGSESLRAVIARLALSRGSQSSEAVMQSLLALSSLYRFGHQSQATRFKVSALRQLMTSSKSGVTSQEAIQHVAAGMLLCAFEIQQTSETSNQWLWYLSGVKNVMKATHLNIDDEHDSDCTVLLDWVYYHDVMAQFSMRHWRRSKSSKRNRRQKPTPIPQLVDVVVEPFLPMLSSPFSCFRILGLFSEVCNTIIDPSLPAACEEHYQSQLTWLEWQISRIPTVTTQSAAERLTGSCELEDPHTLELFQLAFLIYLARASGTAKVFPDKMNTRLRRAFAVLAEMETCKRQFLLLVLGGEAKSDADRKIILDLIARTEEHTPVRSLASVHSLVQSLWTQDDLARQELRYTDKLTAVLSSSEFIPIFV